jgi:pimeloyl-ACP methyl ester carboxylesterase
MGPVKTRQRRSRILGICFVALPAPFSIRAFSPATTATTTTTTRASIQIESGTWDYKGHPIAYDKVAAAGAGEGSNNCNHHDGEDPILLLNGFGMGSFHQHRLMGALAQHEQTVRSDVYSMDYLGQGNSWPIDCNDGMSPWEAGLRYCGGTWVDQTIHCLEQYVLPHHSSSSNNDNKRKVHLVGNSVGGHLAVHVAAARPDLVRTVALLNATPVWGLGLPGWSGHLPAPAIPKAIGRYLFDVMRSERTIGKFLEQTYANRGAYDVDLIAQVRACTAGAGGHAAFASILWSPPVRIGLPGTGDTCTGFYDSLRHVRCDVLLCFGRDDPWCKPAFARRMLTTLTDRTGATQRYIEFSNVGHCTNHEAPVATAKVLSRWLRNEKNRRDAALLDAGKEVVREAWGETILEEKSADNISLNFIDRLAVALV